MEKSGKQGQIWHQSGFRAHMLAKPAPTQSINKPFESPDPGASNDGSAVVIGSVLRRFGLQNRKKRQWEQGFKIKIAIVQGFFFMLERLQIDQSKALDPRYNML